MTIHFRSRIQSPIDYSPYLFGGVNGCCCTGSNSQGATPFQASYGECMASSGYFYVSENGSCSNSCLPQGRTGCCCACQYNGMTEGIEKSVCEDKNGIWQEGTCPSTENEDSFCMTSYGMDARIPRKCCGFTLSEEGAITPICVDVCSEEECSKQKVEGNYVPVFYPDISCTDNSDCPQIQGTLMFANSSFLTGNPIDDIYGNCCIQGKKCRCLENITYSDCEKINGSFYQLQDKEFSCADCFANCTKGEF